MHKKIISAIAMTLGIIITSGSIALADPTLDQQLDASKGQYSSTKGKVEQAKKKANDLTAQIEKLDSQIQQKVIDIDKANKDIKATEDSIKLAENDIQKAQDDIKVQQEKYNKSIRAMYMSGNSGYVDALLDSKGINEFVSKVEVINKVADNNKKIINNLNERKKQVDNKKEALNGEKSKLVALQADNNKKVADLNKQKDAQKPLLDQANNELNAAIELDSAAKAKVDELNKQVAAAKDAEAKNAVQPAAQPAVNRGINVPPSAIGNSVVAYAASFQGIQYVWGGVSPSPGFDCSGLMQYVYAHFGVSIPRTSEAQFGFGTAVDKSQLQPGDLVFFNGASHVGMYIGNGLMIHAPHRGDVVKIIPLEYHGGYCGARRVR